MGKSLVYAFDYMRGDFLCSTVKVYSDDSVEVQNFSDDIVDKPFGIWSDNVNIEDVEKFFEYRCMPKTRFNCKQVLKSGDIQFYNPIEIVRKNQGRLFEDDYWIRFHN